MRKAGVHLRKHQKGKLTGQVGDGEGAQETERGLKMGIVVGDR